MRFSTRYLFCTSSIDTDEFLNDSQTNEKPYNSLRQALSFAHRSIFQTICTKLVSNLNPTFKKFLRRSYFPHCWLLMGNFREYNKNKDKEIESR